jgi:hypothetical protein
VHFTVDGAAIAATATANASGVWSFTPTGLADGSHTIVASETNAVGATGTSSLTFTLDTTAPNPVIIGQQSTLKGGVLVSGTSEPSSTVSIYDSSTGALVGTAVTAANGTWSFSSSNSTATAVKVTAVDVAGNSSFGNSSHGTTVTLLGKGAADSTFDNGGTDTFVFSSSFGNAAIQDVQAANDVLQLSHTPFSDYASELAHAAQVGPDVPGTIDLASSITLHDTTLTELTKDCFHII